MRRRYRLISGPVIALGIAFIVLALFNTHRGLPATSLAAVRALPGDIAALSRRWLRASPIPGIDSADQRANSLQALREAIGCATPQTPSGDPGTTSASYRWRDADGVANFADTPPTGAVAAQDTLRSGHEEFVVTVRAEDAVLPAALEGSLNAGARRVYQQWREWLGDEALVRSHINLRFINDSTRFHRIYGKAPGDAWTATGFYRIQSNEALVLYTPPYRAHALDTAFHEMSHLITAWHLGLTPPWLNEGIAEYFETMQVSWQGARFADNRAHRDLLREQGPLTLDQLLALTPGDWREQEPPRQYASAWALIAFLLDSTQGEELLRQVIQRAHAERCSMRTDPAALLDSYPGGRPALEADWKRWIRRS